MAGTILSGMDPPAALRRARLDNPLGRGNNPLHAGPVREAAYPYRVSKDLPVDLPPKVVQLVEGLQQAEPEEDLAPLLRAELEFLALCRRERARGGELHIEVYQEVYGEGTERAVRIQAERFRLNSGKTTRAGVISALVREIGGDFFAALETQERKWLAELSFAEWVGRLLLGRGWVLGRRWRTVLLRRRKRDDWYSERRSLRRILEEVADACLRKTFDT